MPDRQEHQHEVLDFLHKHLSIYDWKISLPPGHGRETYFVHGFKRTYFVKVGVEIKRYLAMADAGLTPPIFVHGQLESGAPVIVQQFVKGRIPSRHDYREHLSEVAERVRNVHRDVKIQNVLPAQPSALFKDAAVRALDRLCGKWARYRPQVPNVANFVDQSLEQLARQIDQFSGGGLVASHGDICNANWLFASNGDIYLLDFESMSMDDPALDVGALLWWYYPPEARPQFLEIAGYPDDEEFKLRMRVRMAMHCLDITLPRDNSFDTLDPESYGDSLNDFRAVLHGQENPQGYLET